MAMSKQEICEVAQELERIRVERNRCRINDLQDGRDFNTVTIKPGTKGILLIYPRDTTCAPDAHDVSISVDVDYAVVNQTLTDGDEPATDSIEQLSLEYEWGASEHVIQADILRGVPASFHGQRIIVRYIYELDAGTDEAPVTQPDVSIRGSLTIGDDKASPGALWNLRKTIPVGTIQNATETGFFKIPPWAIYAYLQIPGVAFAGTALIMNQYAAPNGTLLATSIIGHGEGSASPVVQGARYFTIDNIGPTVMPSVRVIWVLGV
jgi:hypothetical protein